MRIPDTCILKFTADFCGPCKRIQPKVEELQEKTGIQIIQIDVTQHEDLCTSYGVTSIPVFIELINKKETDRLVGIDETKLTQMVEDCLQHKKKQEENQIDLPISTNAEVKK